MLVRRARAYLVALGSQTADHPMIGSCQLSAGTLIDIRPTPVLAPLPDAPRESPVEQVVATVGDCARQHLGRELERWQERHWSTHVQEMAMGRPQRVDTFHGLRDPRFAGPGLSLSDTVPSLWS